jgi:CheY-like chemotaxis protein
LRMCSRVHGGYVLVVDDERDLRETLFELITHDGFDVRVAANGREALDMLRMSSPPCLIVLDLMMPLMDGFEFCRLKKRDPALASIPVCVMTAAGPYVQLPAGAIALIRKPIHLDALTALIRRYCERPQSPI